MRAEWQGRTAACEMTEGIGHRVRYGKRIERFVRYERLGVRCIRSDLAGERDNEETPGRSGEALQGWTGRIARVGMGAIGAESPD